MRWIIVALSLLLPCSAQAAVYDFSVSNDYTSGLPRTVMFAIDLATPTNGQSFGYSAQINDPDNSPVLVDEVVRGLSFAQNSNETMQFFYTGTIDTANACISCAPPLGPTVVLGDGSTQLQFIFAIDGTGASTVSLEVTIPDELGPSVATSVPELSTWAMLLLGFAMISFASRRIGKRRDRLASEIRNPVGIVIA